MTRNTQHGACVTVFINDQMNPNHVFLGVADMKSRRITARPLSPEEARNIANWLNLAADHAERSGGSCTLCDGEQK